MQQSKKRPEILFIIGSLRRDSLNRQMAEAAITEIGDRAETPVLEWADVPIFDQDAEFPAPASVARVREQVKAADAIWFATPEYNHGVPGGLKNLIDWLSRPISADEPAVIVGKLATVTTVAGSSCGRYVHSALLPTFDFLKLEIVAAPFTCSSFDRAQFTASKLAVTAAIKTDLARQADALLGKLS